MAHIVHAKDAAAGIHKHSHQLPHTNPLGLLVYPTHHYSMAANDQRWEKHNSESIQMTQKAISTVVSGESKRTTLRGGVIYMSPPHLWRTQVTLLKATKLLLYIRRNQSNSDHARSAGKAVTHGNTECDALRYASHVGY